MTNVPVGVIVRARDTASRVFGRIRTSISRVGRAVFSLQGAIVALGAVGVLRVVNNLVKAFAAQEEAVVSLRGALIATGRDGEAAMRTIIRSAGELQDATTHGDEAIIDATASFITLADKIPVERLADAQRVMIGLADTFFKGDINNAALLLGKTLASQTNALTRYGIEVNLAGNQQERLAQVLDQTNKFFQVSLERATSLNGRIARLKNRFGDFKEALGAALAEDPAFGEFISKAEGFIKDLTTVLLGDSEGIQKLFGILGDIAVQSFVKAFAEGMTRLQEIEVMGIPLSRDFLGMRTTAEQAALIIEQSLLDLKGLAENASVGSLLFGGGGDATVPDGGGGGRGGRTPGRPLSPGHLLPSIITPTGGVDLSLQGALGPQQVMTPLQLATKRAEEAVRELAETMGRLGDEAREQRSNEEDAALQAQINSERMEQAWVGSIANITEAVLSGTGQIEVAFIHAITNILQALPGVGGLAGGVIGLVGGGLAALFGRREEQPVRITRFDPRAERQLEDKVRGPEVVNVTIVDKNNRPVRVVQRILRDRELRDSIDRFSDVVGEAG